MNGNWRIFNKVKPLVTLRKKKARLDLKSLLFGQINPR